MTTNKSRQIEALRELPALAPRRHNEQSFLNVPPADRQAGLELLGDYHDIWNWLYDGQTGVVATIRELRCRRAYDPLFPADKYRAEMAKAKADYKLLLSALENTRLELAALRVKIPVRGPEHSLVPELKFELEPYVDFHRR